LTVSKLAVSQKKPVWCWSLQVIRFSSHDLLFWRR